MHIHVTGASGSGTTTLGAAIANEFSLRHFDGDDYYWTLTTPPFQVKRDPMERLAMLKNDLRSCAGAVVSGSILDWGAEVEDEFGLIIFLYLPSHIRVQRLQSREIGRYGVVDEKFLTWAAQYDEGPPEGRSLAKHEVWLSQRRCPVLRLEGDASVSQRVELVRKALPNPLVETRPNGNPPGSAQ